MIALCLNNNYLMYCNSKSHIFVCVLEIFVKKWLIIPQQIVITLCKIKISTAKPQFLKNSILFLLYVPLLKS